MERGGGRRGGRSGGWVMSGPKGDMERRRVFFSPSPSLSLSPSIGIVRPLLSKGLAGTGR